MFIHNFKCNKEIRKKKESSCLTNERMRVESKHVNKHVINICFSIYAQCVPVLSTIYICIRGRISSCIVSCMLDVHLRGHVPFKLTQKSNFFFFFSISTLFCLSLTLVTLLCFKQNHIKCFVGL